jgi:hypothetical protein
MGVPITALKALGNKLLGKGTVSNEKNPSSDEFASGQQEEVAGMAPSSGDAESGACGTEPVNEGSLFPDTFCSQLNKWYHTTSKCEVGSDQFCHCV